MKHPILRWMLIAGVAACLSGCHSDGADVTTDIAFLRTPNIDAENAPAISEQISLLFPTGPTRRWQMAVRATNESYQETVQVAAPRSIGGVESATDLSMSRDGKIYRHEIFQVTPDTLSLVASGDTGMMTMSPPMPILKAKASEGAEYKWQGSISFKDMHAPAQAYSRIHGSQDIQTPAGKFHAYRVDTILSTIISGRQVDFPSSRWFAPGIGIVKQSFRIGRITVAKDLQSYTGG